MSNQFPYPVTILYEDDDCLVINKPAGVMVHADGRSEGPFITDWVVQNYPGTIDVGEPIRTPEGETVVRPGIVHRLDKETSGALLIAKTREAHARLKQQFQDRLVLKKYLAFVWGEFTEEFGTITRPIGRSNADFRKWSAQRGARGEMREAETYWTRLWTGQAECNESNGSNISKMEKFSLVEAVPKTGRTHQIRVHLLAIHHPVVGDILYAPKRPMVLGFSRLALHSYFLEFENGAGKHVVITAPLPEDFAAACKRFGIEVK